MKKHNKLIIFGENHNVKKEIRYINNFIKKLKPNIILHELAYDDIVLDTATARNRIKNCKINDKCDPRLNKDVYKLAYQLKVPLIGIDKTVQHLLPLHKKFEIRENHMIKMIKKYQNYGRIVIVVIGDTHLRTIKTKELGNESKIYKIFKDKAIIIRSQYPEIA